MATKREGFLYLHIIDLPKDERLVIPAISNSIKSITVMGSNNNLDYSVDNDHVEILYTGPLDNTWDTVIEVKVEGMPVQLRK